jgi:hypothetical protein
MKKLVVVAAVAFVLGAVAYNQSNVIQTKTTQALTFFGVGK